MDSAHVSSGHFLKRHALRCFDKAFTEAFEPNKVVLNSESLCTLYKSGCTSALRLGHSKIEINYHDHSDPALFVLDAKDPRDLIDYWNLRANRRHVVPVPMQWLGALSEFCKEFIVNNYRPLPGNQHGVMIHPTVMFARSIPSADIERLHADYIHVDVEGANYRQDWYPSLWRPSPGYTIREMRPTLSASVKSFDVPYIPEKPEVRFDTLYPDFADEYGNQNRWANVVSLRDWSSKDQIAIAFPNNYRKSEYSKFRVGREEILPTTEGFVIFPRYKNIPEYWEMQDGNTAISNWLKSYGVNTVLSDAGRTTQQIIQTLGGFGGVASFAHADIVRLLNEISRSISRSAHQCVFR